MKNALLLFVFSTTVYSIMWCQNIDLEWLRTYSSTEFSVISRIESDNVGNIVIFGHTQGTTDINPLTTIDEITGQRYFIQKLTSSGTPLWNKIFEDNSDIYVGDIKFDDQQNIIICGSFGATVDFDLGSGTSILSSNGGSDSFILKLSSDGDFVWVKSVGSSSTLEAFSNLSVDNNNNIIACGDFTGLCDFDPGLGISEFQALTRDGVVVKLNQNGDFLWAYHIPSKNRAVPFSLTNDSSNDIYIGGEYIDSTYFDGITPIKPEQILTLNEGFILKLSENGIFQWVNTYGTEVRVISRGANDKIYAGGYFYGTESFGISVSDTLTTPSIGGFVQMIDHSGNNQWVKPIHSTSCISFTDISINAQGVVVLSGSFHGETDFDTDPVNETIIIPSYTWGAGHGAFLLKLSDAGEYLWVKPLIAPDYPNINSCTSDNTGAIYASGDFYTFCDFGSGYQNIQSTGIGEGYILKIFNNASTPKNQIDCQTIVYPIPFTEFITVESLNDGGNIWLISDELGKVIVDLKTDKNINVIDLSFLSNGTYFLLQKNNPDSRPIRLIKH